MYGLFKFAQMNIWREVEILRKCYSLIYVINQKCNPTKEKT